MVVGYCMKCKKKREMQNIQEVKNKKGLRMAKGSCPICNTNMCRILGK